MRILSLDLTRKLGLVAVSPSDQKTRITGLSSFTVYWSLNGGAPAAMVTPTVAELDSVNMPGVYALSVDEAALVTLPSGEDFAQLLVHVSHGSMEPVTLAAVIERFGEYDDEELDTTTDPALWRVNRKRRGGSDIVGTKLLRDKDGNSIAQPGILIASMKES